MISLSLKNPKLSLCLIIHFIFIFIVWFDKKKNFAYSLCNNFPVDQYLYQENSKPVEWIDELLRSINAI